MNHLGSILLLLLSISVGVHPQSTLTRCRTALDMIIAIDGSNSMGLENFQIQLNSVAHMVSNLDVSPNNVHAGALLYSIEVMRPIIPLSSNKPAVVNGIRSYAYPDQQTRTDQAINEAIAMFQKDGRGGKVPQSLIIVTDGVSTMPQLTAQAAAEAKRRGIIVFAVGVTGTRNLVDMAELRAMATSEAHIILTPNFQSLENALDQAADIVCVNLECGQSQIDMVFMLDSSASVGAANFQRLKEWVMEFLYFAHIHVGNIRVGLMTFSDNAVVEFNMLRYNKNEAGMNQAIRSIQYRPGGTNIAGAFSLVRNQMFTVANGDRQDAPDIVFFVSASMANVNQAQTQREAEATRAAGIQVFGLGIGLPSTQDLDSLTSRPLLQHRFVVPGVGQLNDIIQPIYNNFNRFCRTPPPVPACFMGQTDLWYVVDLSSNAEKLSRFDVVNQFPRLKNGLRQQINIVLDPSVANPEVRMGLVTYSDQATRVVSPTDQSSVQRTLQGVNGMPGFTRVGGSNLIPALQQITTRPQQSRWKSYVAVVAPQSAFNNLAQVQVEFNRLRQLGYTIVVFTVRDTTSAIQPAQIQSASTPSAFYYLNEYVDLEAATKNFTRDLMCVAPPPAVQPPVQFPIVQPPVRVSIVQPPVQIPIVQAQPVQIPRPVQIPIVQPGPRQIPVVQPGPRQIPVVQPQPGQIPIVQPGFVGNGLCRPTRYQQTGMDVTVHPTECDKYVQCYWNAVTSMDIAVVRSCPVGLHWSQMSRACVDPVQANCAYDKCKEDCGAYKTGGTCGAYIECEAGRSKQACCKTMYSFVPGKGCRFDPTCKDECKTEKWCGVCAKRPNFRLPYGYDVLTNPVGGNQGNQMGTTTTWSPRHCDYNFFDVVTCDCTADMNAVCPADRSFNFRDGRAVQQIVSGVMKGIRVKDTTVTPTGLSLGPTSELHVDANKPEKGSPFSLKLRFSKAQPFSQYGEVLLTSGMNCGMKRGIVVSADNRQIRAQVQGRNGSEATLNLPYQGIPPNAPKDLAISYAKGMLTMSLTGQNLRYVAQTTAPDDVCISCGIDIGGALNQQSFTNGMVESIQLYSCELKTV